MTPRQAQIALVAFFLLAAGVVYNALYMQSDPRSASLAGEVPRAASSRVESVAPARSRNAPVTKRTALLKPDSAKISEAPQATQDEAGADTIRGIQLELSQRGFGPLVSDGVMRPATRAAIMSYEHDHRLPLTGEATEVLLARLVLGASATNAPSGNGEAQSPHAEALIKQVQRLLTSSGYRPGPADGRLRPDTIAAIRAYEQDQGLNPKGRISAEVLGRLQNSATRLKAARAH